VLVRCPECGCEIRNTRLQAHVSRVHGKQVADTGTQPSLTLPMVRSKLELQNVLRHITDVLRSERFSAEIVEDKVLARFDHARGTPYGLFISILTVDSPKVQEYLTQKLAIVIHVSKFQQRIWKIKKWLYHRDQVSGTEGLASNVLTSFGWHAKLEDESRCSSLMAAASELGETRVIHVLEWMRNTWPNHPYRREEDVINVRRDHYWFYVNFGEHVYSYHHLKWELDTALIGECQRLISGRKTSLFQDILEVNRRFLVVY
jgi:hypothetical protein